MNNKRINNKERVERLSKIAVKYGIGVVPVKTGEPRGSGIDTKQQLYTISRAPQPSEESWWGR